MNSESKDKQLAISRTGSFRRFQSRIGSATYRLNTIFVGLEHIAAGKGKKANGLAVTWTEPATPESAKQVADQARSFACLAATALAFDVTDRYLFDLADEEWLGISESTRSILTKSVQRPSSEGGAYGLHERASEVASEFGVDEPIHVALLELLAKWRNTSVHGAERKVMLSERSLEALSNTEEISTRYSHLDIRLALENLASNKVPVPKEITSLIASAQNFFRKIDEAAIIKVAGSEEKIRQIFIGHLRRHFLRSSTVDSANKGAVAEFFRAGVDWRRAYLLKVIAPFGLTATTKAISAPISDTLIDDFTHLDAKKFLEQIAI